MKLTTKYTKMLLISTALSSFGAVSFSQADTLDNSREAISSEIVAFGNKPEKDEDKSLEKISDNRLQTDSDIKETADKNLIKKKKTTKKVEIHKVQPVKDEIYHHTHHEYGTKNYHDQNKSLTKETYHNVTPSDVDHFKVKKETTTNTSFHPESRKNIYSTSDDQKSESWTQDKIKDKDDNILNKSDTTTYEKNTHFYQNSDKNGYTETSKTKSLEAPKKEDIVHDTDLPKNTDLKIEKTLEMRSPYTKPEVTSTHVD